MLKNKTKQYLWIHFQLIKQEKFKFYLNLTCRKLKRFMEARKRLWLPHKEKLQALLKSHKRIFIHLQVLNRIFTEVEDLEEMSCNEGIVGNCPRWKRRFDMKHYLGRQKILWRDGTGKVPLIWADGEGHHFKLESQSKKNSSGMFIF